MVFEFLKWSASFKEHERGVGVGELSYRRPHMIFGSVYPVASWGGDLTYKRPHPLFDFHKWDAWAGFLALTFLGSCAVAICVVAALFFWSMLFIGWLVFCFLHFAHSIRFIKLANLTDVHFMPISSVYFIGNKLLTDPDVLDIEDYYILYSRYFSADVKREPYKDVTEWVNRIRTARAGDQILSIGGRSARAGDQLLSVGGRDIATSIGGMIGVEYHESLVREAEEIAVRIPEPEMIMMFFQSAVIPVYRDLLGDDLALFYLVFLSSQPPILPYDEGTSRREMCEVASADDTAEVLAYLDKYAHRTVYKKP